MKKNNFYPLHILFLVISLPCLAQENRMTLAGYVYDKTSGEPLINATITLSNEHSTTTNSFGYFSLQNKSKEQQNVVVQYLGFQTLHQLVTLHRDTIFSFYLEPNTLGEVVITSERPTIRANVVNIPVERLKSVPTLVGQPDVIKALSFIPGVSTGMEGTSGLFVRGGTPDQNLILLDGATVYNASHLFGFQSVFDPAAIKEVKLIKGGFPARYGSRLSSVIDITMKEGNNQTRKSEASIGLISSSFMTEGLIKKGISSYMISGRASYWGLVLLPTSIGKNKTRRTILINDLNVKINHQFKNKDKFFFSLYSGQDLLKVKYEFIEQQRTTRLNWGNRTASLRYIHAFGARLFSSSLLNYNFYQLQDADSRSNATQGFTQSLQSSIQDVVLKQQFSFGYGNNQLCTAGMEVSQQKYNPSNFLLITTLNKIDTRKWADNISIKPIHLAFFVENENHLGKHITTVAGVRLSDYRIEGKNYTYLEPRASLNYTVGTWNYTMSYAFTSQFIHLISNISKGFNNDIWIPSTAKIRPQTAHLLSTGITWQPKNKGLEVSLEGYYKRLENQVEYIGGSSYFQDWQQKSMTNGLGRAYGVELMLKKESPRWDGWVSYTYSKNERKFEQLNQGEWYLHKYDRRHNLNLTASYKITSKWKAFSNFVYQTGARTTFAKALYLPNQFIDRNLDKEYDYDAYTTFYQSKNNQQLPNYHRLDVGLSKNYKTKRGRHALLTFGVYNLYARANPYGVWLDSKLSLDEVNNQFNIVNSLTTGSLFNFVPSIAYSLKW